MIWGLDYVRWSKTLVSVILYLWLELAWLGYLSVIPLPYVTSNKIETEAHYLSIFLLFFHWPTLTSTFCFEDYITHKKDNLPPHRIGKNVPLWDASSGRQRLGWLGTCYTLLSYPKSQLMTSKNRNAGDFLKLRDVSFSPPPPAWCRREWMIGIK